MELISAGGKIVENPTTLDIVDEINLTVIPQLRVVYDLFMEINEEFFDYPKGKVAVDLLDYSKEQNIDLVALLNFIVEQRAVESAENQLSCVNE